MAKLPRRIDHRRNECILYTSVIPPPIPQSVVHAVERMLCTAIVEHNGCPEPILLFTPTVLFERKREELLTQRIVFIEYHDIPATERREWRMHLSRREPLGEAYSGVL